jgi:hypothetical protein
MEKLHLNLEALEVASFATTEAAAEPKGTVQAHDVGPTRHCFTPECTADTCI